MYTYAATFGWYTASRPTRISAPDYDKAAQRAIEGTISQRVDSNRFKGEAK